MEDLVKYLQVPRVALKKKLKFFFFRPRGNIILPGSLPAIPPSISVEGGFWVKDPKKGSNKYNSN